MTLINIGELVKNLDDDTIQKDIFLTNYKHIGTIFTTSLKIEYKQQ